MNSKTLVWVTNSRNPYEPGYSAWRREGESYRQAIKREKQYFDSMIQGRPKETDAYTVEELEAMGMVGLYRRGVNEHERT